MALELWNLTAAYEVKPWSSNRRSGGRIGWEIKGYIPMHNARLLVAVLSTEIDTFFGQVQAIGIK